jgi:hypothetical protein
MSVSQKRVSLSMKTEILVAIIETSGIILAAVLTGTALLVSAFAVYSKKQLRKMLIKTLNDLQYFKHLEIVHTEMEVGRTGKSNQLMARKRVNEETGLTHSGMGINEVKQKLQALESQID